MNYRKNYMYFVFSAEKSELDIATNTIRTGQLREALIHHDLPWLEGQGVYRGDREVCFMVQLHHSDFIRISELKKLVFKYFYQESMLVINHHREASLLFNDKNMTYIGQFCRLPSNLPQYVYDNIDHTFINGSYYTCKADNEELNYGL